MKSRYGNYIGGKRPLMIDYTYWDMVSSSSKFIPISEFYDKVFSDTDYDYTYGKGVWGLTSTMDFVKTDSKVTQSGLTGPLFSVGPTWDASEQSYIQYTIDIARYVNKSARVVFKLDINGASGSSDYQLDLINVSGTSYSFENVTHSFQTTTAHTRLYEQATWTNVAVATTNARWNVDTGGTPSGAASTSAAGGTYYIFGNSIGTPLYQNYRMWLRSPVVSLGATPTLSFYLCRFVAGPYLSVHLDIQ